MEKLDPYTVGIKVNFNYNQHNENIEKLSKRLFLLSCVDSDEATLIELNKELAVCSMKRNFSKACVPIHTVPWIEQPI